MRKVHFIVAIICLVLSTGIKAQVSMNFEYVFTGQVLNEYDTLWNVDVLIAASGFSDLDSASLTVTSSDPTFTSRTVMIRNDEQFQYTQDVISEGSNIRIKFYSLLPNEYHWRLSGRKTDNSTFIYEQ